MSGMKRKIEADASCPYLDTINRSVLDFDFEPSCSVTLESGPHVYGCLVCGKFFRGKGRQTPAYTHAVDEGHFVFVHLSKGTYHCLPDDYRILDPSLADISAALHPSFSQSDIERIDDSTGLARDLFGRRYLPGYVGLNNLHKTDCINAVVQALAHVRPLRNYFLSMTHNDVFLPSKKAGKPPHKISHLVLCFGELIRKIWSDKRFKSHVDPHMLINSISSESKKRFQIGKQAEVGEFMAWFLNQIHVGLGGSRKPGSSIIYQCFQGRVRVTTRQRQAKREDSSSPKETKADDSTRQPSTANTTAENTSNGEKDAIDETTTDTNFLQLTLDIPEKPLFRDAEGALVIPQEPLVSVLRKFDGITFSDAISRSGIAQRKRYQLLELPKYLILHLARFKSNNYTREKNPTIVAFPVKNLDLSSYVFSGNQPEKPPSREEIQGMSVKEIKAMLQKYGHKDVAKNAIEKSQLVDAAMDFVGKSLPDMLAQKYDLVANITHESPADVGREGSVDPLQEGSYKCHVHHDASKQWYEIQDLHVRETMPQLIGVSESYLLIFEKKQV